ncbi:MAG: hypothetical protein AAF735_07590 [Myxococcota bacterium]
MKHAIRFTLLLSLVGCGAKPEPAPSPVAPKAIAVSIPALQPYADELPAGALLYVKTSLAELRALAAKGYALEPGPSNEMLGLFGAVGSLPNRLGFFLTQRESWPGLDPSQPWVAAIHAGDGTELWSTLRLGLVPDSSSMPQYLHSRLLVPASAPDDLAAAIQETLSGGSEQALVKVSSQFVQIDFIEPWGTIRESEEAIVERVQARPDRTLCEVTTSACSRFLQTDGSGVYVDLENVSRFATIVSHERVRRGLQTAPEDMRAGMAAISNASLIELAAMTDFGAMEFSDVTLNATLDAADASEIDIIASLTEHGKTVWGLNHSEVRFPGPSTAQAEMEFALDVPGMLTAAQTPAALKLAVEAGSSVNRVYQTGGPFAAAVIASAPIGWLKATTGQNPAILLGARVAWPQVETKPDSPWHLSAVFAEGAELSAPRRLIESWCPTCTIQHSENADGLPTVEAMASGASRDSELRSVKPGVRLRAVGDRMPPMLSIFETFRPFQSELKVYSSNVAARFQLGSVQTIAQAPDYPGETRNPSHSLSGSCQAQLASASTEVLQAVTESDLRRTEVLNSALERLRSSRECARAGQERFNAWRSRAEDGKGEFDANVLPKKPLPTVSSESKFFWNRSTLNVDSESIRVDGRPTKLSELKPSDDGSVTIIAPASLPLTRVKKVALVAKAASVNLVVQPAANAEALALEVASLGLAYRDVYPSVAQWGLLAVSTQCTGRPTGPRRVSVRLGSRPVIKGAGFQMRSKGWDALDEELTALDIKHELSSRESAMLTAGSDATVDHLAQFISRSPFPSLCWKLGR